MGPLLSKSVKAPSADSFQVLIAKIDFNIKSLLSTIEASTKTGLDEKGITPTKKDLEVLSIDILRFFETTKKSVRIQSKPELLESLRAISDNLYLMKSTEEIDFNWVVSVLRQMSLFIEESLDEIQKIDSVRGTILSITLKSWVKIFGFVSSEMCRSITKAEKKIIDHSSKVNNDINSKIKGIHTKVEEMNKIKSEHAVRIVSLEKDKLYLAKIVRILLHREEILKSELCKVVAEKNLTLNENITMKLDLLKAQKNNNTDKYYTQVYKQLLEESSQTMDTHVLMKRDLRKSTEVLSRLVQRGLEEISLDKLRVDTIITEQGTSTEDLFTFKDASTNTVGEFEIQNTKKQMVDKETKVSLEDILSSSIDFKKKAKLEDYINSLKKFSSEYHLQNAPSTSTMTNYIFDLDMNEKEKSFSTGLDNMLAVLYFPERFKIIYSDKCKEIEASLRENEQLKIRFNEIGENITNLKVKNTELEAHNKLYENENLELMNKLRILEGENRMMQGRRFEYEIDWSGVNMNQIYNIFQSKIKEIYEEVKLHRPPEPSEPFTIQGGHIVGYNPSVRQSNKQKNSQTSNFKPVSKGTRTGSYRTINVIPTLSDENQSKGSRRSSIKVIFNEWLGDEAKKAIELQSLVHDQIVLLKPNITQKIIKSADLRLEGSEHRECITSITQILKLKGIAKRIRKKMLENYSSYKRAYQIVITSQQSKIEGKISMPQGSLLALYAELLTNLIFEFKLNSSNKIKYPFMVYVYEYMSNTYNVKKLADSKFKNLIDSLRAIGMKGKSLQKKDITKLDLLSNFLWVDQQWDHTRLDYFLEFYSRFEDPIKLAGENSSITECKYSELSEIILNPEICHLNTDNRNSLLGYMESMKYVDETDSFYKIRIEPIISHYYYLWDKQNSLVDSIIGNLWITYDNENNNQNMLESWEFGLLCQYIESSNYEEESTRLLFYRHADSKLDYRDIPAMSLSRFARVCLIKQIMTKEEEKRYHKNTKRVMFSNLEVFTQKYRTFYRSKLKSILSTLDDHRINYDKLFDKIDYALANKFTFSKKAIQSTFYILESEVRAIYLDNLVKNTFMCDELGMLLDLHKDNVSEDFDVSKIKPEVLELDFKATNNK